MDENYKLLDKSSFEKNIDGKPVSLYTLNSGNGMVVQVTNFGLHVVSIWCKDKHGKYADVTLGYKDIESYINGKNDRYIGSVVGRYANRIAKGQFSINGKTYNVPINNNGQSLHGGVSGFDLKVWDVDRITNSSVEFSYISPDGDEGYPGNLTMKVVYSVTPENELRIDYHATTDKPTIVNLTNHAFFNLKGEGNGAITDHIMTINADHFTPMDSVQIPTGEILKVESTPLDFRTPRIIGECIDMDNQQIRNGAGYDHNWVIDRKERGSLVLAASLYEPISGRILEVYTDQPGIQCYTGNFFDGKCEGKSGRKYQRRGGLALETQNFPDSPNRSYFPSPQLNPGEEYTHICIFKLGVK